MLRLFPLVTLFVFSLVRSESARAGVVSAYPFPELSRLMEILVESAQGGASLEFFAYSEAPDTAVRSCALQSGAEAFSGLVRTIELVLAEGDPGAVDADELARLRPIALQQLKALLVPRDFQVCSIGYTAAYSRTEITLYLHPEFSFLVELGWED